MPKQTMFQKYPMVIDKELSLRENMERFLKAMLIQDSVNQRVSSNLLDIGAFTTSTDSTYGITTSLDCNLNTLIPSCKLTLADPDGLTREGVLLLHFGNINALSHYKGELNDFKYQMVSAPAFNSGYDLGVILPSGLKNGSMNVFIIDTSNNTFIHIYYDWSWDMIIAGIFGEVGSLFQDPVSPAINLVGVVGPTGTLIDNTFLKLGVVSSVPSLSIATNLTYNGTVYTPMGVTTAAYLEVFPGGVVSPRWNTQGHHFASGLISIASVGLYLDYYERGYPTGIWDSYSQLSTQSLINMARRYNSFQDSLVSKAYEERGFSAADISKFKFIISSGYGQGIIETEDITSGSLQLHTDSVTTLTSSIGGEYLDIIMYNYAYADLLGLTPEFLVILADLDTYNQAYRRGREKGYTDSTFIDPITIVVKEAIIRTVLTLDTDVSPNTYYFSVPFKISSSISETMYIDEAILDSRFDPQSISVNSKDYEPAFGNINLGVMYDYSIRIHPAEFAKMDYVDQIEVIGLILTATFTSTSFEQAIQSAVMMSLKKATEMLGIVGVIGMVAMSANPATAVVMMSITAVISELIDNAHWSDEEKMWAKLASTILIGGIAGGFSFESVFNVSNLIALANTGVGAWSASVQAEMQAEIDAWNESVESHVEGLEALQETLDEFGDTVAFEYAKSEAKYNVDRLYSLDVDYSYLD